MTARNLARLLAILVPALVGALSSYWKTHAEASKSYEIVAEEVRRQGEAIEALQKSNDEWKTLLVQSLLRAPTASSTPVLRPLSPEVSHRLMAPQELFRQRALPKNFQEAAK